eukprot:TRINITY_DN10396_c0_g1_i1.p1 TRINITY_DN10396_c0_g1~~TRINITY_DN10396_c0_g1_i1.p1  ORF type:complete len:718 (+),score=184.86 TRINITY_DN10396_c0_g1_i1:60-2213(+)
MENVEQAKVESQENPVSSPYTHIVGVDFGTSKLVVSLYAQDSTFPSIIRNDISDLQTPNILSFSGNERVIGENARGQSVMNPLSSVTSVNRLLGKAHDELKSHGISLKTVPHGDGFKITVPYANGDVSLRPEQIAAMFLRRFQKYTLGAINSQENANYKNCVLTVPHSFNLTQRESLKTAAKIAGFNVISVVPEHTAVATLYALKYPISEDALEKNVVFVDVGHVDLTISYSNYKKGSVTVLHAVTSDIGSRKFDDSIFSYASDQIKNKFNFDVNQSLRYVERLRQACQKVKHTLSTVKEAELNFVAPDRDIKFFVKQSQLEEWLTNEIERVKLLIQDFLSHERVQNKVDEVTVIGGGSRVPIIQKILEDSFGKPLARGLDSSLSVGLGASSYGAVITPGYNVNFTVDDQTQDSVQNSSPQSSLLMSEEEIALAIQEEDNMVNQDNLVEQLAKLKNDLESFTYARKSDLSDPKFDSTFDAESRRNLISKLDEIILWLEDNQDSDVETYTQKLESVRSECAQVAPKYFEKLNEIEQEKIRSAAEAAASQATAPSESKKSKTPRTNSQKLEAALEKKEHGNKLFVDLDYPNAIRRYTQAIELVISMYDANPEQTEEGNKVKIACYNNMANCLFKVKLFPKVIENCKLALEVDANNSKAYFWMGQAHFEMKEYDLAVDDFTNASRLNPSSKDVKNWLQKSKNEVTKREQKEKKMYSAMFS